VLGVRFNTKVVTEEHQQARVVQEVEALLDLLVSERQVLPRQAARELMAVPPTMGMAAQEDI